MYFDQFFINVFRNQAEQFKVCILVPLPMFEDLSKVPKSVSVEYLKFWEFKLNSWQTSVCLS